MAENLEKKLFNFESENNEAYLEKNCNLPEVSSGICTNDCQSYRSHASEIIQPSNLCVSEHIANPDSVDIEKYCPFCINGICSKANGHMQCTQYHKYLQNINLNSTYNRNFDAVIKNTCYSHNSPLICSKNINNQNMDFKSKEYPLEIGVGIQPSVEISPISVSNSPLFISTNTVRDCESSCSFNSSSVYNKCNDDIYKKRLELFKREQALRMAENALTDKEKALQTFTWLALLQQEQKLKSLEKNIKEREELLQKKYSTIKNLYSDKASKIYSNVSHSQFNNPTLSASDNFSQRTKFNYETSHSAVSADSNFAHKKKTLKTYSRNTGMPLNISNRHYNSTLNCMTSKNTIPASKNIVRSKTVFHEGLSLTITALTDSSSIRNVNPDSENNCTRNSYITYSKESLDYTLLSEGNIPNNLQSVAHTETLTHRDYFDKNSKKELITDSETNCLIHEHEFGGDVKSSNTHETFSYNKIQSYSKCFSFNCDAEINSVNDLCTMSSTKDINADFIRNNKVNLDASCLLLKDDQSDEDSTMIHKNTFIDENLCSKNVDNQVLSEKMNSDHEDTHCDNYVGVLSLNKECGETENKNLDATFFSEVSDSNKNLQNEKVDSNKSVSCSDKKPFLYLQTKLEDSVPSISTEITTYRKDCNVEIDEYRVQDKVGILKGSLQVECCENAINNSNFTETVNEKSTLNINVTSSKMAQEPVTSFNDNSLSLASVSKSCTNKGTEFKLDSNAYSDISSKFIGNGCTGGENVLKKPISATRLKNDDNDILEDDFISDECFKSTVAHGEINDIITDSSNSLSEELNEIRSPVNNFEAISCFSHDNDSVFNKSKCSSKCSDNISNDSFKFSKEEISCHANVEDETSVDLEDKEKFFISIAFSKGSKEDSYSNKSGDECCESDSALGINNSIFCGNACDPIKVPDKVLRKRSLFSNDSQNSDKHVYSDDKNKVTDCKYKEVKSRKRGRPPKKKKFKLFKVATDRHVEDDILVTHIETELIVSNSKLTDDNALINKFNMQKQILPMSETLECNEAVENNNYFISENMQNKLEITPFFTVFKNVLSLDNNNVICSHCEIELSELDFFYHSIEEHNGIALPINFNRTLSAKEENQLLKIAVGVLGQLQCKTCLTKFVSIQGYVIHRKTCGLSDAEKYTICEACKKRILNHRLDYHSSICIYKTVLNESNCYRPKRKAALKCSDKIKSFNAANNSEQDPIEIADAINSSDVDSDYIDATSSKECDSSKRHKGSIVKSVTNRNTYLKNKILCSTALAVTLTYITDNFSEDSLIQFEVNDWILNDNCKEDYLPTLNVSVNLQVKENKNIISNWDKLKVFSGKLLQKKSIMFCGGPIICSAWCPYPVHFPFRESAQFMAVCCISDADKLYSLGSSYVCKCLIQIWCIDNLNNQPPKMAFGIAHDYGNISCLKWCPSGGFEYTKETNGVKILQLGLLAAASSDGCIYIYFVSTNSSFISYDAAIYKKLPEIILKPYSNYAITNQCLKIDWFKGKGHKFVAASYSDGTLCVWNVFSKPGVLSHFENSSLYIVPIKMFQAHAGACTTVSFSPYNNGYTLVTGGIDLTVKIWDLKNINHPIKIIQKERVTDSLWPIHFPGVVISFDDLYSAGNNQAGITETGFFENKMISFNLPDSPVNSLSYSKWLMSVFLGTENGSVILSPLQKFLSMTSNKFNEEQILCETQIISFEKLVEENSEKNIVPTDQNFITGKYGLVLSFDISTRKNKHHSSQLTKSEKYIGKYPICSISCVEVNDNIGYHDIVFVGFQCGIGAFININGFESKELKEYIKSIKCK